MGPFTQYCLDKALGLAVGLRGIGLGSDVLEHEGFAGIAPGEGLVAGTVVGHDPLDAHAEALVVSDGGLQEGDGADCFFVRLDLGESDPGVVVDTDVDEFPALVAAGSMTGAIAGDAVTDLGEAAQFLDVDVDQLAGLVAFIAQYGRGGFQRLETVDAEAPEDAADGGGRHADSGGDALAGPTLAAQFDDALDHRPGCWPVQASRPRGAVFQSFKAFAAIASDPFAHRPRADACG